MQLKLGNSGYVMVTGVCQVEPETSRTSKGTLRCTASLVVGEREDGDGKGSGVWANLTAWGTNAAVLSAVGKGDSVLAVGQLQSWERDGRTYKALSIGRYGFVCTGAVPDHVSSTSAQPPQLTELDDDGELPF